MKTIIKIVSVKLLLLLLTAGSLNAQAPSVTEVPANTYSTAIGVRGGWFPGITAKHFLTEKSALEGIFQSRGGYRGASLTGLLEYHKPALNIARMNWFYGAGGHIGFYRYRGGDSYRNWRGDYYTDDVFSVGIDGIIGLEYHFEEIPFTLGIDLKPFIDIINPGFGFFDGAVSIRYTLEN